MSILLVGGLNLFDDDFNRRSGSTIARKAAPATHDHSIEIENRL